MLIQTSPPEQTASYDAYLKQHPYGLLYYSSKYKNFLKQLLQCEEIYLLATENGVIKGILPLMYLESSEGRIYNSLPYYGSNGFVLADTPEAFDALAATYNNIVADPATASATVVENPFVDQTADAVTHNFTDQRIAQFTDIADFSDDEDPMQALINQIDNSAKRNIKKALREEINIEIDNTKLNFLQKTHQDNMRAIGGLPKSDEFFRLIPKHFTPGEDYNIYIAKKSDKAIAALLLFYFNQTVEYFTPAIQNEYRSSQPLALIIITAMVDAYQRGFKYWNWGGTWISQTGVYRFKRKWAAQEKTYHYYTQLNNKSLLNASPEHLVKTYPNFFVLPFSQLTQSGGSRGK